MADEPAHEAVAGDSNSGLTSRVGKYDVAAACTLSDVISTSPAFLCASKRAA